MTARSILVLPDIVGTALSVANYAPHGDGATVNATVDYYHYRPPVDLSVSRLSFTEGVASGGTGKTYTAYLNGTASALAVSVADGGSVGTATSNNTDLVSVTAGDRLSFVLEKTGGTSASGGHRAVLSAPGSGSVAPHFLAGSMVMDHTNRQYPLSGNSGSATYAADTRMVVRTPGDWRGLFVNVSANSGSEAVTIAGGKGNVDTAMSVTIGVGETGLFWDNSNVITVSEGDYLNYRKSGVSGASITVTGIGSSIVSDDRRQQLYGFATRAWNVSTVNAVVHTGLPGPDYGTAVGASDSPKYERSIGYPARIGGLLGVPASSLDVDVVGTMYVNGTATALTVTIPAGSTLTSFEDTTHTVDVGAEDLIGFKWEPVGTATTGTFNLRSWSVIIEDTTAPFKPKITWSR